MLRKLLLTFLLLCFFSYSTATPNAAGPERKNVIFMITDGTNSDVVTLARHYKGKPLALDQILTGAVKTYSLESAITDSAAAATAMATGKKTMMDYIGMVPLQDQIQTMKARPVANVLEAAQEKGLATGLVATSPVQHATPAAFSAHSISRHKMEEIGLQQAHQSIDVILGGGNKYMAKSEGRSPLIVQTRNELLQAESTPIYGSFAKEEMAYHFDRQKLYPEQPSLAEMTKQAIHLLKKHKNGFFLLIEGSKVDYAAHQNDPVGMISELLAFDAAVEEALHFAKKDPQTLLIAVTDHGNSGLTMGNEQTDQSYAQKSTEQFVQPLKKAKLTVTGALSQLTEDRSNLKEVLESYGLHGLSKDEIHRLKNSENLGESMVQLMAKRAHLGFTTRGHTGEDVFLYAYGPNKPTGLINNTDLTKKVIDHLELEPLKKVTAKRFVEANPYYQKLGYQTKIEHPNGKYPVFIAEKGGEKIEYHANRNIKITNGQTEFLNGVVIHNGTSFWIPQQ